MVDVRVSYKDTLKQATNRSSGIKHTVLLVDNTNSEGYSVKEVLEIQGRDYEELNNGMKGLGDNDKKYKLFFDQSTNTGYALFQGEELRLTGKIEIGTRGSLETYKFNLKDIIDNYIEQLDIEEVWYEEVYDEKNMRTTEVLMYVKHLFKDINYTIKKQGKELGVYGVDHTKWKSILSDKGIKRNQNDKEEVRKYVFSILNLGTNFEPLISEDMSDALGMGIARSVKSTDKSFYMMARYESKLPINEQVVIGKDIDFQTIKLRKPLRDGRDYGTITYESEDGKLPIKPHELARRVLSHRDVMVAIEIPKNFREYGILLLLNNIKYDDFKDENDKMYMVFSRKRRL